MSPRRTTASARLRAHKPSSLGFASSGTQHLHSAQRHFFRCGLACPCTSRSEPWFRLFMRWISVYPWPPPSAAATASPYFVPRFSSSPIVTNTTTSPPSSDSNVDAFLAAVAEFLKRPTGPFHSPGALPPPRSRYLPAAYNTLMKSFSRSGDTDEVLRLFHELRAFHPTPNALCYNTVINALLVAGRINDATEVFDEMITSGVAPTTSSYTILLKKQTFYPELIDWAYYSIQSMVKSGCQPDAITYSTLIVGLCRARRIHEALGVLDQMLEDKLLPTVESCTSIVHGYCSEGRIKEAYKLVSMMESFGCPPDVVTYSVLIQALCQFGDFDEVERMLRESEHKNWKPNEVTYNIYMSGLCRVGKVDEAFQQLHVMKRRGLHPDIITLNILFDCLCRGSKVWEAKFMLEKSAELEWDVDVFFYNTLMSRLCDIGKWVSVLKLLTDMLKKGIDPDTCTFTIVMRSLCKAGMLPVAKSIIQARGFAVDVIAFNTLLHEFYIADKFTDVRLLYSSMVADNVVPNTFTYGIMIDTLCRERNYLGAICCYLGSLSGGFVPHLYTRLTNWLVKARKLGKVWDLHGELSNRGLSPDASMICSLISVLCWHGYCRNGNLDKVCLILDRILGII